MEPSQNNGSQWDRVAAELRACREAQQRAWGDIDNTTLGRFLAGEVSADEQRHIENALAELPELRKLTDLVRDVLGESESMPERVSAPQTVPYGPAILSFSQPQPMARTSAPAAASASHRNGRPWLRDAHFRQRAGLVAAAGLLLVLGFTLPRADGTSSSSERSLAMTQPVAARIAPFDAEDRFVAERFDRAEKKPRLMLSTAGGGALVDEQSLIDRVSASVLALETEGKPREAEQLARRYASNLTRQALVYQAKGDLASAEPVLHQACTLCDRTWGPEAPVSIRTRNSLAGVYEVALNATPAATAAFASSDAVASYSQKRSAPPPRAAKQMAPRMAPPPPAAPRFSHELTQSFRAAPPPAAPFPSQPRPMVAGAAPSGRPPKGMNFKIHHSHHAQWNAHNAAFVLRERLTRKSQRELKASVVPVLTKALREATDAGERQRLARALGQLGPAAREAVPLLIEHYRAAVDSSERATLLRVVGDIGPAARQAMPVLLEVIQHAHNHPPDVYRNARWALVQLAPATRCRGRMLAKPAENGAFTPVVRDCLGSAVGRSGIVDDAECFTVSAIQRGQQQIHFLAQTRRIEVLIETLPGKAVTVERADLGSRGVYLCINKDAPQVRVFVSEALRERGLTDEALRQKMEPALRKKDFDGGLQAGIEYLAHFEGK